VTFTVTSAVPSLAVQRVGGAEGSLLGTEKCIPGDVFDNDEWISGVANLASSIQDLCGVTARAHNKKYKRPRRGSEKEDEGDGDDNDGADGEEEASAPKKKLKKKKK
jgi:hypothetical protein